VRRSSDDAEDSFTATEVSDGTLAAFCGANDGFVTTWHDQSGNGRDASQATDADQPQIVDAGSLVTEGGKPSVLFGGSGDHLSANSVASVFSGVEKPLAAFAVLREAGTAGFDAAFSLGRTSSDNPIRSLQRDSATTSFRMVERSDSLPSATVLLAGDATVFSVVAIQSNMTASQMTVNGAAPVTGSHASAVANLNTFSIGCLTRSTKSSFWDGTISEIVVYPSDQSANRQRIEGNIAWYY
jgi:hypothetical protein